MNTHADTNTQDESTKIITIRKSQLFKQFKRVTDIRLTGQDPLVLQVWNHRDEIKEHYKGKGEFYPDGGPVTRLGWTDLTENPPNDFEWHHTKQDAINSCLEHGPCDSEEELSEENIETNFSVTNGELLQELWTRRKQVVELRPDPREGEERDIKEIKIQWEDDTTAEEFLRKNFGFYGGEE